MRNGSKHKQITHNMQNYNIIGIGSNAATLCGYALSATGRIGPIALIIENLGNGVANPSSPDATPTGQDNTATLTIGELTSSGYVTVVPAFTVKAGGKVIKTLVVHTAQIGFFGTGNTKVSVTIPNDQAADLRGSHIDVQPVGKFGWGLDTAVDGTHLFPTSTETTADLPPN
jgi:hypothetical protein